MTEIEALQIVWDLANENALPEKVDQELLPEYERQQQALQVVANKMFQPDSQGKVVFG